MHEGSNPIGSTFGRARPAHHTTTFTSSNTCSSSIITTNTTTTLPPPLTPPPPTPQPSPPDHHDTSNTRGLRGMGSNPIGSTFEKLTVGLSPFNGPRKATHKFQNSHYRSHTSLNAHMDTASYYIDRCHRSLSCRSSTVGRRRFTCTEKLVRMSILNARVGTKRQKSTPTRLRVFADAWPPSSAYQSPQAVQRLSSTSISWIDVCRCCEKGDQPINVYRCTRAVTASSEPQ